MPDELLRTYDDDENEVEPQLRSFIRAQAEPKKLFASMVGIWVLNTDGKPLCSKRADHLEGYPGLWQSFFGGHVKHGSDYARTAIEELDEEAGIIVDESELFKVIHRRTKHKTYATGYAILFDLARHTIKFNDGEVSEVRWLSFDEYRSEVEKFPDQWCNAIAIEDQEIIEQWLKQKTS